MKRLISICFTAMIAALVVPAFTAASRAEQPKTERAVVEFQQNVKLYNVILRGSYLILHDDERMAQGEPCLYVYRYTQGRPDELVASLHCKPVLREKTDVFKVVLSRDNSPYGLPEVSEIQFAGFAKAHQIP